MPLKEMELDFWIKNGLNVMFIGKHGVGKTTIVKEAFSKHFKTWKYFSASTMDPWVDFVGVPKETQEGDLNYLKLVRPKVFADGSIEALFFDELNRASKKIRNAVMELIQFKSINGEKFPNLKCVWAAINPADDDTNTYDVEQLDPAQFDRFEIQIELPYKPDGPYFINKYGRDMAKSAIDWWTALLPEQKNKVSPRRLDDALRIYNLGGNLRNVLPDSTNVSKLVTALGMEPVYETLKKFQSSNDWQGAKAFVAIDNNYLAAMKHIGGSESMMGFFLPLLPKEKIATLLASHDRCARVILQNSNSVVLFKDVCQAILDANTNTELVKKIKRSSFGVSSAIGDIGTLLNTSSEKKDAFGSRIGTQASQINEVLIHSSIELDEYDISSLTKLDLGRINSHLNHLLEKGLIRKSGSGYIMNVSNRMI